MPLTPEALLSVFKSIDLDDSGTIELRELEAFCAPCLLGDGARQSSAQQSRITELFAQVDTDGSGVISFGSKPSGESNGHCLRLSQCPARNIRSIECASARMKDRSCVQGF